MGKSSWVRLTVPPLRFETEPPEPIVNSLGPGIEGGNNFVLKNNYILDYKSSPLSFLPNQKST